MSIYDFPVEDVPWFADVFKRDLAFLASRGWKFGDNLHWTWPHFLDPAIYQTRLAEELARKPDVIFCGSFRLLELLADMEKRIPILCLMSEEVHQKLVGEWRRPGGNVTGIVTRNSDNLRKRLQFLLDLVPDLGRIVVVYHELTERAFSGARIHNLMESLRAPEKGSRPFSVIEIVPARFSSSIELEKILSDVRNQPRTALFVEHDWPMYPYYPAIISGALRAKVPAIYSVYTMARNGGLIEFVPDIEDLRRTYLDQFLRIFGGTSVAEIPAVFPNVYRIALNLQTARAIDLIVPPDTIARADEVID